MSEQPRDHTQILKGTKFIPNDTRDFSLTSNIDEVRKAGDDVAKLAQDVNQTRFTKASFDDAQAYVDSSEIAKRLDQNGLPLKVPDLIQ